MDDVCIQDGVCTTSICMCVFTGDVCVPEDVEEIHVEGARKNRLCVCKCRLLQSSTCWGRCSTGGWCRYGLRDGTDMNVALRRSEPAAFGDGRVVSQWAGGWDGGEGVKLGRGREVREGGESVEEGVGE